MTSLRLKHFVPSLLLLLPVVLLPQSPTLATARSSAGPTITLTYYWWAESDVPGADNWMHQTIALFEKAHPNIRIKLDIQSNDTLQSNFAAAAVAHSGPDIATQWATMPVLSQAWSGAIVPLNGLIPASEMKHWVGTAENAYGGKVWGMPLYLIGTPVVYNKTLFSKAGLDPNKPPTTWAEFLSACAKLKAKGIIPFAMGNKDGFAGAWFWNTFGKGSLNSVNDVKRAVVGQTHFTDPQFTSWLTALQTMRSSGYLNNDVASLDLNNGTTPFVKGQAAMTFTTDANVVSFAHVLGEANVGVFREPSIGNGKLASFYDVTQSSSEMITSWSKHQTEAAMFLMFMHTPERLAALNHSTSAFPADDRFNTHTISDPLQRQMLSWDLGLHSVWLENFVPTQLDSNGDQIAGETVTSNGGSPGTAAQLWERTARQWRASNPTMMKQFSAWIGPAS